MTHRFIKHISAVLSLAVIMSLFVPCTSFAASTPTISASSVKAKTGGSVSVAINMANNPGIVSATLTVTYNSKILTLTKVKDGGLLGNNVHKPEYSSPYTLAWENDTAQNNYMTNGKIAVLTFKVSKSAAAGTSYPVKLSYNFGNYDIYNKDLKPVSFTLKSGSVTAVKDNPLKVSASKMTVSASTLKKKSVKVKPLTIKGAQGKVSVSVEKKGTSSSVFKKIKVNRAGTVTFKKGSYKRGNCKVKLKVSAGGNAKYLSKSITKTVTIKIK